MNCSTPGFHVPSLSPSLLELMSIESMMPSNNLILCCPLLCPPSTFPGTRVFSNELVLPIRWPMYWSFSLIISHFNEYSGLISYRTDRFDLHAVQGTLKSFLQHHSSKATILWCTTFFLVQLSYPHMTSEKPITWTIWTFVGKVTSLLFNMLSRFVIAFLTRSKHFLISWLQSLSAMMWESNNIKSVTAPTFFLTICHEIF